MLLEPGERTEDTADVAADLTSVAAESNSVVIVAEAGRRLVGYIEARGGGFSRNRHTAHIVIGVRADIGGRGSARPCSKNWNCGLCGKACTVWNLRSWLTTSGPASCTSEWALWWKAAGVSVSS